MTKVLFTFSIWYMCIALVFVSFGLHFDLTGRWVVHDDPTTKEFEGVYVGGLIDALYNANYQLISPQDFAEVFHWTDLDWDGVLEPLGDLINQYADLTISAFWIGAQVINIVDWLIKTFSIAFDVPTWSTSSGIPSSAGLGGGGRGGR